MKLQYDYLALQHHKQLISKLYELLGCQDSGGNMLLIRCSQKFQLGYACNMKRLQEVFIFNGLFQQSQGNKIIAQTNKLIAYKEAGSFMKLYDTIQAYSLVRGSVTKFSDLIQALLLFMLEQPKIDVMQDLCQQDHKKIQEINLKKIDIQETIF